MEAGKENRPSTQSRLIRLKIDNNSRKFHATTLARFQETGNRLGIYSRPRYNTTMAAINPNISLFHGENLYLLEKTLENWFQNFEKKHGDINITIIDSEEELNAKTIINALESAPFLGENVSSS